MNVNEIVQLLKKVGFRETKAETYPNTYSFVSSDSFLAQQVNNRDSASWKKAEYIILTDVQQVSHGILNGWRKLTERDPLPRAIQKLCVQTSGNQFNVYDSQGNLIKSDSLEKIIKHTPDILDILNDYNPLTNVKSNPNSSSHPPSQIIYYGVPGCGKSYEVNKDINDKLDEYGVTDREYHKVRCVFHPEYCNADFVGQIYPKIEEKTNADGSTSSVVVYEFKPGPFAEIVRRAYQNPDEPFFLIIEEINRGNAAAIFGDTFQLLDRIKIGGPADDSTENVYGEGWSSYGIDNQDVNAYIRDQQRINADKPKGHCSCVKGGCSEAEQEGKLRSYPFVNISSDKLNTTWVHKDGGAEKREEKTLHFSANTAIRLPPNLSILATMNTSDQNVFTLDNAFQRRFDMELVRNEFDLDKPSVNVQYNAKIADTNIKWGQFWEWINKKIVSTLKGLSSTEDKRLGVWFVSNVNGKIEEKVFAEKVLKYLWDDAFKFKRSKVFVEEIDTLEKLIAAFEKPEQGKSRFAVFKNFPEFSSSGAERSQNEGAANP